MPKRVLDRLPANHPRPSPILLLRMFKAQNTSGNKRCVGIKDGCKYLTQKIECRVVEAGQSDHPLIIPWLLQTTPSTPRLIQKGTPRNLPLLQLPLKFIQRSAIIFAILGMFSRTMPCHVILDQAAHDDKPPVIHGNKKKMYHIMRFRTKKTKCFFCICCVKYHMFLCFNVFGNAPIGKERWYY